MESKFTNCGNVVFFEYLENNRIIRERDIRRGGGVWKLHINVEYLFNAVIEETSEREHRFADTLKIGGNRFIMGKTDARIFERLYRYAIDSLTSILRPLFMSIRFPAVCGVDGTRIYATIDSRDIDDNLAFSLADFVERFLVARITYDWYLRCNLFDVANICKLEADEVAEEIKGLIVSCEGALPISDYNTGYF